MGLAQKKRPLCPSSTHALLIGNDTNKEWQQNRSESGDVQFNRALSCYGQIPKQKIVSLQDANATKSKAESCLKDLCEKTFEGDSLIFYYGGHGKKSLFCTEQEPWYHTEVLSVIESKFRGSFVLIVADCCYSGSFSRALKRIKNKNRVSYICIMSTLPNTEAISDWIITNCLIRALKGDILLDLHGDGIITVDEIINFTADEVAKIYRDRISCYCLPGQSNFPINTLFLNSRVRSTKKVEVPVGLTRLPLQPAGWTGLPQCYTGEKIFFKQQEPPIWSPAIVVSKCKKSDDVCLDAGGYHETVPRKSLLRNTHFFKYNVPFLFLETLCDLAKQGVYVCTTIPIGTKVKAFWVDGSILSGRVVSIKTFFRKTMNAKKLLFYNKLGPHVTILWRNETFFSLVPISKLLPESFPKKRKLSIINEQVSKKMQPYQLLKHSLKMNGKRLINANDIFLSKKLKCFFPKDGLWYEAESHDHDKLSCHALASHYCYEDEGDYVAIKWGNGKGDHIIPVRFVMPQFKTCIDVQCFIAHHYRYLYYTIPPNTLLNVQWRDNIQYKATVVSNKEFPWQQLGQADIMNYQELGPYVLIRWDEGDIYSIVPLSHCSTSLASREKLPANPRDALLKSLISTKKQIRRSLSFQDLLGYNSAAEKWMEVSSISEGKMTVSDSKPREL